MAGSSTVEFFLGFAVTSASPFRSQNPLKLSRLGLTNGRRSPDSSQRQHFPWLQSRMGFLAHHFRHDTFRRGDLFQSSFDQSLPQATGEFGQSDLVQLPGMAFQLFLAVVRLFLRQVPPGVGQFRQRFDLGRLCCQFFSGKPPEKLVASFCQTGQPLLGVSLLEQEPSADQIIGIGIVRVGSEAFFGRADLSPLLAQAFHFGPLLVELFTRARPRRFLTQGSLPSQSRGSPRRTDLPTPPD